MTEIVEFGRRLPTFAGRIGPLQSKCDCPACWQCLSLKLSDGLSWSGAYASLRCSISGVGSRLELPACLILPKIAQLALNWCIKEGDFIGGHSGHEVHHATIGHGADDATRLPLPVAQV